METRAPNPDTSAASEPSTSASLDFIRTIIEEDLASGKHARVVSRFPPEPNGYLHIGHAKSICLNFGVAAEYNGVCHLRFDDTNPATEDIEYVESIQRDVRWLGFDWQGKLFYASDYFEALYSYAVALIKLGKAYVCGLNEDDIRSYRGTITEAGRPSPDRERPVAENLDLFERMRRGEFPDGAYVLRAKIDMASPNMKMRDPAIYRIRHKHHYRQGDKWCIYPLYDFTHGLSDSLERITHSLCTLEFENNRELYDWFLNELNVEKPQPRQIEFARLSLTYTLTSKRKLLELVRDGHVSGWDDPRMPTIAGLRRRGYTASAIRAFCERIGVAKNNSVVDFELLEYSVREDLNRSAPRVLSVLKPLKVVIENFEDGRVEDIEAPYFPPDVGKAGARTLPFSKVIYIEQDDFQETPQPGFFRLAPGQEVRLRYAYVIRCTRVIKDAEGQVTELVCSYDPESRGASSQTKKVKGTIHWVSAAHALPAEVRLYERMFSDPEPDRGKDGPDFKTFINPASLTVVKTALVEPALAQAQAMAHFQFERLGFFVADPDTQHSPNSAPRLVFNRVVTLRDSWAKEVQKAQGTETEAPRRRRAEAQEKASLKQQAPLASTKAETKKELSAAALALKARYGVSDEEARLICEDAPLATFFEATVSHQADAALCAKWITNELLRELKGAELTKLAFGPQEFAELLKLIANKSISGKIAKDVFAEMVKTGTSPGKIVEKQGARQISSEAELAPIADRVLAQRMDLAERYRAGNEGVLGALVGMLMKETQGRANPELANSLLKKKLGA